MGDLRRDLIPVATPFLRVQELDVDGRAVVAGQGHAVAQDLGLVENVALVEVVQHAGEFGLRQADAVVRLKLRFQVGAQPGTIGDGHRLPTKGVQPFDHGVCQTSCPPISCGVSDFGGAGFGFGV